MESWSASDDERPYVRAERKAASWPWLVAAAVVLAIGVAAYFQLLQDLRPAAPAATPAAPEPITQAPPPPPAEPAVRHPVPEAAAPSLPTLDNSDSLARESLVDLLGRRAFDELVLPAHLVRRIVATVDNLPRRTAPRLVIPLASVPGAFTTAAENQARYAPFIRVLEAIDSQALVQRYVRAYPLFQRAYEELGFPGKYFNDRLMQAIDDLLAAPEPAIPPLLVQSKVLYEFVDPELEARSAGQKILLRMGIDNAHRVKAKLREIRSELVAASRQR